MSGSKHTILFLAAEPGAQSKARMGSEHTDIREAWRSSNFREMFDLDTAVAATTAILRQRLLDLPAGGNHVLHIVGDDSKGIFLPKTDNQPPAYLDPGALAGVLRLFCDRISTVVMSGCYDEAQALAISQLGQSEGTDMYVVGLKSGLKAEDRIKLSVSVYQALCSGRDEAFMARFVDATLGLEGIPETALSVWHNGLLLKKGKTPEPEPAPAPALPEAEVIMITNDHAYLCDRVAQEHEFVEISREKSEEPFLFFGIHGDDPQSHSGLVKKLYRQFLVEINDGDTNDALITQVVLREAQSLKAYQHEIRGKLVAALKCSGAALKNDGEQWKAMLNYLQKAGKRKVTVEFRVRSAHWKEFTPELIRWFAQDYCKPEYLGQDPPRFFFFLSIVYENQAEHNLHLSKIRKAVTDLPGAHVLEELMPVSQSDIEDWIQEFMEPTPNEKRQYLREICFDNLPTYNMADVQERLEKFIRNHPLKAPEF